MSSDIQIPIDRESDIVTARQKGRELAAEAGFAGSDLTVIATAISEVARNIVTYAVRGEIRVTRIQLSGKSGIQVVASDHGPGIPDIALALRDGYSTGKSLGLGLPGAKRLMDEFEIASKAGQGTTVTMRKWTR
ncbi:MAG TPA: anti-sigma regulatory factor [Dongiaceae bacterium]|nr:anti-sigma regulatory factor [Dongiaceae bacterium]